MTITVSTDGSALGNPNGPMGWAWADHELNMAHSGGHEHGGDCDAGGATNGTNQIGELCAVLEALRAHPGAEPLVIETDSQYAINCSTKWVHGWKKNGWKNSQKKPVKNAALIRAIDAELSRRAGSVKFVWVKGHAGNAGNEKVDDLARTYAGDCRSGVQEGYLPKEGWQSLLASEYAKGTDVPEDAQMLLDGKISTQEYHLGRGGRRQRRKANPQAIVGGAACRTRRRARLRRDPVGHIIHHCDVSSCCSHDNRIGHDRRTAIEFGTGRGHTVRQLHTLCGRTCGAAALTDRPHRVGHAALYSPAIHQPDI